MPKREFDDSYGVRFIKIGELEGNQAAEELTVWLDTAADEGMRLVSTELFRGGILLFLERARPLPDNFVQ